MRWGLVVTGLVVAALAGFVGVGLSQGWFNNDDAGDTLHPDGAIWALTIPKHFIKGGFGGATHSVYTGPQEGPDYSYIELNDTTTDLIRVEVVHGQTPDTGQALLDGVRRGARSELSPGDAARDFRLTRVAGHPAVTWRVSTRSQTGYPLAEIRTYVQAGSDAPVVSCQWRTDKGNGPTVERGCTAVLGSFRIVAPAGSA